MTNQHNKGPVSGAAALVAEPDMDGGLSAETLALVRKTVKDAGGEPYAPQKPRQKTRRKQVRKPVIGPMLSRLGHVLGKIKFPSRRDVVDAGTVDAATDTDTTAKSDTEEAPATGKRDRTYLYLLAFGVIFFLPSWVVPSVLLFAVAMIAIIYLSLGPDRLSEIVLERYEQLKLRNPARAESLRLWAQQFAARLAWFLGKLPEKWTEGLQIPTFHDPAQTTRNVADDPFKNMR